MARLIALWLTMGGLAAAGCGSDSSEAERPGVPDGPPEERIAATVNAFFEAWHAGEGELACSYLTERGQRLTLRIVREIEELRYDGPAGSCEDAIEGSARATGERIGQMADADRVRIDSPDRAVVTSEFRGELPLRKVHGEWFVDLPGFFD